MDSSRHKYFTGVPNEGILDNYKRLLDHNKTIITRVPVIPSVNNNWDNFTELSNFLEKYNPGCRIDLLPYHSLGIGKYDRLNKEYKMRDLKIPSDTEMEKYCKFLQNRGFHVTIGG